MATIKIENVVASTSLGVELDLQSIALALDNAEYEPEQFPGLVCRLKDPKTAALLFRSGKVVCSGAESTDEVGEAVDSVAATIEASGGKVGRNPDIIVQDIVASAALHPDLNVHAI